MLRHRGLLGYLAAGRDYNLGQALHWALILGSFHMVATFDLRRQGSERLSVLPEVTGPRNVELQASPGLPEAEVPVLPTGSPCQLTAACHFKRQARGPSGTNPVTSEHSRWAPALLCLPFHLSDHGLCPPSPEHSFSLAQVCFLGASHRCTPGPGGLLASLRYPQAG